METLVTQIYTLYSLGFNSCPDVQSFFSFFFVIKTKKKETWNRTQARMDIGITKQNNQRTSTLVCFF